MVCKEKEDIKPIKSLFGFFLIGKNRRKRKQSKDFINSKTKHNQKKTERQGQQTIIIIYIMGCFLLITPKTQHKTPLKTPSKT